MTRGTFKQRSASTLRFPASVAAFAAGNFQKFALVAPRRSSSIGRGQPPIREMLVFAALHESGSGTSRHFVALRN